MWGMKKYYLGHVAETDPRKLEKVLVGNKPCTECETLGVCGGRCLYANITRRWNDEAYGLVCDTVKGLIRSVESQMPRIKQMIANGKISAPDFEFVKYNGCEIIP
jgi:sulfatase maturation enzyme AslB (radical SAM superfamily)